MKTITHLLIWWATVAFAHAASTPTAINVIGAVRRPKALAAEESMPLDQVIAACDGIVVENWKRTIIISKEESAILTISRKYEFRSIRGDELYRMLEEITVSPGEVVFIPEGFD